MGQASLAVFYVVFGVLTIYLNLETIVTWDANGIYRTVSAAVREYPFPLLDVNKTKHMEEVEDPWQVYSWMANSFKPMLFQEQKTRPTNTPWASWNYSMTPATIGGFNRILLVRFTFKRWAVEETRGAFKQSTPYRLAGGTRLSPDRLNQENRTKVCAGDGKCIQWQTAYSFDQAGGYTEFFDPMQGPDAYDALLKKMNQAGLFDMLMATCTVDMVLYNANVDFFLQYIHSFSFDFSGHIHQSTQARGFNLNVFDKSVPKYLELYIIQCVCLVMVVIFGLIEVRRLCACGLWTGLQKKGAVTDMISITVSFGVLTSYFIIEQMQPFQNFQFQALQNMETRAETYVRMCDAARALQIQGVFIALNLLVVSLRTVSLVSGLHSNLGLILRVIGEAAPNFAVFIVLFGMLLTGFVLTSFFAFGPGYAGMSNIWLCIYKSFTMLCGGVIFDEISRVDNILGPIYFFSFYILFYLVLINIFIVLLMCGYDMVDYKLQWKNPTESEKNPLVLIFEELKADVLGSVLRYGDSAMKCSRFCWDPIVVSVQAACSPFSFLTEKCCKRRPNLRRDPTAESQSLPPPVDDDAQGTCGRLVEFVTAVLFMASWIFLAVLYSRGLDAYLTKHATLTNVLDTAFYKDNDMKVFDQIHTYSDVKSWADTAIVGLYNSPVCAESVTNGASIWTNNAGCDSSSNSQQLLNRIADWNIGFLNTTFVRLTIQPACFVSTDASWASGSPLLRKTPDVECWNSVCTQVLSTERCRTADGNILDAASLANSSLPESLSSGYEAPNHLGPFRMLGGLALGLGVTKKQCQDTLALLDDKQWFTKKSASIVFDWLTYNGNVDFFTHNVVAFSLLETGLLHKSFHSATMPLNVESGGGYFHFLTLILVLFAIYALLLLYHMAEMGMRMVRCFWKVRHMNHRFKAFFQEFCNEPWNIVELSALVISLATYVFFLAYVLDTFRSEYKFSLSNQMDYVVPNDDVKYYHMKPVVNPERHLEDDWYIFKEFEQLQLLRGILLQFASMNSLWTGFKTIKTITKNFKAASVFGRTLANVRVVYFLIVIMLQMLGFAFAMTVLFGTTVEGFSTPSAALQVVTFWVCAPSDLYPLMAVWPGIAVILYVAFTIIFRFISANMFLATQLNTFAALVGEEDIQKAKREAVAKMGMKRVVYHSQRELQRELTLGLNTDLAVEVRTTLKQGKAAQANVKAGDVIYTVNHLKVHWQSVLAHEEYQHVERALMPGQDGSITIMFQNPPRKSIFARLKIFISMCCSCSRGRVKPVKTLSFEAYGKPPALRPTVSNFWRFHGAIAEVEKAQWIAGVLRDGFCKRSQLRDGFLHLLTLGKLRVKEERNPFSDQASLRQRKPKSAQSMSPISWHIGCFRNLGTSDVPKTLGSDKIIILEKSQAQRFVLSKGSLMTLKWLSVSDAITSFC